MAENDDRPVIEATRPSLANMTPAIVKPGISRHFEMKQHMVQLIQSTGPQGNFNQTQTPPQQAEESTNNWLKKLLFDNQQLGTNNQQLRLDNQQVRTDLKNLERQFEQVAFNQNVKPTIGTYRSKYRKFLDILSQVRVNLPLVEMLQEVPKYAKYLRDIVANKRRHVKFERVALTECSARVQSKLPSKLKDPGCFTIPLANGKHDIGRTLCDLGESVNLMPLSIFKQLELGVPRPITITLQLVDRSLAMLEWIIEYVLVRVGKSIFPANFIIFDYMADEEVPVILGLPFLAIGGAIIYVREEKMKMRVHDEEVTFNVYKALKLPKHYEDLFNISVLESKYIKQGLYVELSGMEKKSS
ncbi:uncharacterized protein [Nicotiana tomentosiformis]|uniref:uncharacterized protein n=1 Tax=Nicotiana tomentosiformis TaxID=4098 RepID=UPI00051C8756|nr:uncharacterized protein LOC104105681 [Nicotiana tomentosiformis]